MTAKADPDIKTTIDKFGRVLIPKALRELLGLEPGCEINLLPRLEERTIVVQVVPKIVPKLILDELGIPTFRFGTNEVATFDVVASIAEGREERDAKIIGK